MPQFTNDDPSWFGIHPTPREMLESLRYVWGKYQGERDRVASFAIEKGVTKPIEIAAENLIDLAKGIKAAPAMHAAREILGETGGAGEEAAIESQIAAANAARGAAAGVRLALLLAGSGSVAMTLVVRDP